VPVTGKGLAAVIKQNYSKKLLYMSVFLVVIANTLNIGSDLGAMAATTQLFVDLPYAVLGNHFRYFDSLTCRVCQLQKIRQDS